MTSPLDLSRRALLGGGLGAALGSLVCRWTERVASADTADTTAPAARPGKAKSVILLWMNGGPSHLDTWDPKPGTKNGGPHKAIKTSIPGVQISQHLPQMAELAKRIAIVRGLSTKEGNHQRAQYLLHTGYVPNPTIQHPSLGGWTSRKLGDPKNGLPGFVSIGGPSLGAGFLGVQHGPFVLQKGGDLPQNITYGADVDRDRFLARKRMLDLMEQDFAKQTGDLKVEGHASVYDKAVKLMHSPDLRAFDVSGEPDAVRESFGTHDFGKSCLVAARLVTAGVRFVEVVLDGWDTHKDNFTRTKNLMGALDPGMSGLIKDLERRGLLSSTLVVWMGDFGRTPRINADDGRDHFPNVSSCVLAGAGIKEGVVHGETTPEGDKVAKDAVAVPDLMATVASLLGLDPGESFLTPIGRPIAITDGGQPIRAIVT